MTCVIRDVEFHEDALERHRADAVRRLDLDVMDCALSSWSGDSMRGFHRTAIALLERGAEAGFDGPADFKTFLWDVEGDRAVDAKIINGAHGACFLLTDSEAERFGRRFMPLTERSRVHKKHGLELRRIVRPCKRFMASHCSGVGMPVSHRTLFVEDDNFTTER